MVIKLKAMIMLRLPMLTSGNANLLKFFQLRTYFQVKGGSRQKGKNGALAMHKQCIKHKQSQLMIQADNANVVAFSTSINAVPKPS